MAYERKYVLRVSLRAEKHDSVNDAAILCTINRKIIYVPKVLKKNERRLKGGLRKLWRTRKKK